MAGVRSVLSGLELDVRVILCNRIIYVAVDDCLLFGLRVHEEVIYRFVVRTFNHPSSIIIYTIRAHNSGEGVFGPVLFVHLLTESRFMVQDCPYFEVLIGMASVCSLILLRQHIELRL